MLYPLHILSLYCISVEIINMFSQITCFRPNSCILAVSAWTWSGSYAMASSFILSRFLDAIYIHFNKTQNLKRSTKEHQNIKIEYRYVQKAYRHHHRHQYHRYQLGVVPFMMPFQQVELAQIVIYKIFYSLHRDIHTD